MVRSSSLVLLSVFFLLLLSAQSASGSRNLVFAVETVLPQNGGSPSIAMDSSGRPWIGFSVGGTMQFAAREEGGWSFETVPFDVHPTTGIIIDSLGSPAVAHWGSSGTLHYVHRGSGQWVSESTGIGYFPEASALSVGPSGRPYAICIWSYHYYGYVTLTQKLVSGWNLLSQSESSNWFNPIYAGVDLAVDNNGSTHAIVNPISNEFYYLGPGSGAPFPDMQYFSIAVNSQNEPVVAYNIGTEIQIMTRESGLWELFIVGTVDECGRVDLAIDGDDNLHLAYCDRSSGDGKVVYALRSTYGEPWQFHEIDQGSQVSIALDGARQPHVAYITAVASPAGYDLKYATTESPLPVEKRTWGSVKKLFRDGSESD